MWRLGVLGIAVLGAVIVAVLLGRVPPAVELRAGGVVLLDGRPVSLAALSLSCRDRRAPVLRVEETVPWSHVVWVLVAIQAAGVREVRFDLPDGPVAACFCSEYWSRDVRHVPDGHLAGLVEVRPDECTPRRLAEEAARIARDSGLKPLAHLVVEPAQRFSEVAPALRALRDARLELEFPFWGVGVGEVLPIAGPLPPSPDLPAGSFFLWPCACRPGVRDIDLPMADMAEEDRGQEMDDRLILQLDRDGRVFGKEEGTLDDLAAYLRERRDRYDLKMRQQDRSGLEDFPDGSSASKLYVLIRADRAAPARQVGFILHVLALEGLYKVQFAVRKSQGEDPGPCVGRLAAKLQVFLPTSNLPRIVGTDEPSMHVCVDREEYRLGAAGSLDAAGLGRLVREECMKARADPTRNVVAAVHVASDVTYERVVAAVNEIHRAGCEKIDFVDLAPPDRATRALSPLPRSR